MDLARGFFDKVLEGVGGMTCFLISDFITICEAFISDYCTKHLDCLQTNLVATGSELKKGLMLIQQNRHHQKFQRMF